MNGGNADWQGKADKAGDTALQDHFDHYEPQIEPPLYGLHKLTPKNFQWSALQTSVQQAHRPVKTWSTVTDITDMSCKETSGSYCCDTVDWRPPRVFTWPPRVFTWLQTARNQQGGENEECRNSQYPYIFVVASCTSQSHSIGIPANAHT